MKRTIFISISLIVLVALGYAVFQYFKPHRNLVAEKAALELKSSQLAEAYETNRVAADSNYLDVVIALKGSVTSTEAQALIMDDKVYCAMDSTAQFEQISKGQVITLKGRVIGYDDLFEQVKLDNCVLQP